SDVPEREVGGVGRADAKRVPDVRQAGVSDKRGRPDARMRKIPTLGTSGQVLHPTGVQGTIAHALLWEVVVEVAERDLVLAAEAVIDLGDHLTLIEGLRDGEGEEVALVGGGKEIPNEAPGEGPDAAGGNAVTHDVLPGSIRVRQRAGKRGKIARAL